MVLLARTNNLGALLLKSNAEQSAVGHLLLSVAVLGWPGLCPTVLPAVVVPRYKCDQIERTILKATDTHKPVSLPTNPQQ